MKKTFLCLIIALSIVSCKSLVNEANFEPPLPNTPDKVMSKEKAIGDVPKELAQIVAENFLKELSNSEEYRVVKIDSIPDFNGHTSMYVFNFEPSGFVLTSNNVKTEPIVGYSQQNRIYPNFQYQRECIYNIKP